MPFLPISNRPTAVSIPSLKIADGLQKISSQSSGLRSIQGQSHNNPGRGLSLGLHWREAKTLGLGTVAKGLLTGASWALKGLGSMTNKLAKLALAGGASLHRQENVGKFKQGLGVAAKGLGHILKAPALILKGAGQIASAAASPVGEIVTGTEKAGYLAFKGLAKVASVAAHKVAR